MSDAKQSGAGHVFSSSTTLREQGREIHAAMPLLHLHLCFTSVLCWLAHESSSLVLPNATELLSPPSSTRTGPAPGAGMPRSRRRRYLSPRDMNAILDYHNQVRAQVSPPAANMEYMVSVHHPCLLYCGSVPVLGILCIPELSPRRERWEWILGATAACHAKAGADVGALSPCPRAGSGVFPLSQQCRELLASLVSAGVLGGPAAESRAAGITAVPSGTWVGLDQLLAA